MNRINLRSLGIGFLVSTVITAGFAIIVQGKPIVKGITMNDLFTSNDQIDEHKAEMSSLLEEKNKLISNEEKLKKTQEKLEKENKSLNNEVSSLKNKVNKDSSSDNDTDQNNQEDAGEVTESEPEVSGNFEVVEGLSAAEIANQLEASGFIDSALEFNELIEEWGLSQYIITDTYQLNSDMSIHDIASIITHGAYYY